MKLFQIFLFLIIFSFIEGSLWDFFQPGKKISSLDDFQAIAYSAQKDFNKINPEMKNIPVSKWGFGSITDKLPNFGGIKDKIPSIGGIKDKIPSIGGIKDALPNVDGISSGIGDKIPSVGMEDISNAIGNGVGMMTNASLAFLSKGMTHGVNALLGSYKKVIEFFGKDEISLPDLAINNMGVEFSATGGFMKSMTALSLDGEFSLRLRETKTVIMDIPMKFENMGIGYKHYEVKALGIRTNGTISMGVGVNKINVRLSITISTSCAINLEFVKFVDLDKIEINFSGFGGAGAMHTTITNFMINSLKGIIKDTIQKGTDMALRKVISDDAMFCSKFIAD